MDARARMEARRKKILENAEVRMTKILGRPCVMSEESPNVNCYKLTTQMNGFLNGSASTSSYEEEVDHYEIAEQTQPILTESQPVVTNKEQTLPYTFKECLFFLILGMVIRTSYDIGLSWTFNENLLFPFLITGLPWVYLHSNAYQANGVLQTLLLFIGMRQVIVTTVCKIITFFRILSQLFSLYLFSFIILHCIIDGIPPLIRP